MTRVAPVSPFVPFLVFTIPETSDMPWFPALKTCDMRMGFLLVFSLHDLVISAVAILARSVFALRKATLNSLNVCCFSL